MYSCRIALSVCISRLCVLSVAVSQAISIPPDQFWGGIDGKWSTFQVQVGTPGQAFHLLPGTSASPMSSTWVIASNGCSVIRSVLPNPIPSPCAESRGGLFYGNESTTYSTQRLQNAGNGTIYSFAAVIEGYIGDQGNAYFGFDTISLGLPGSGLPTVRDQVIASLAIPNFWLGFIGLSPWPTNFTSFMNPQPSMLSTLYATNLIPSLSWAYTAGAWYKSPPTFGSLTLGGYDTTRLIANNATFSFGADLSRDLLVSLHSITSNILGQPPLLAQSIDIFVDSLITEIWLPISVCLEFEKQFRIRYDNVTELYLLDENIHNSLLAANPSFTFKIGQPGASQQGNTNTVDIVLPYAAFDLNVTEPIVNGSTRYFPLKRASNEMQYILGRVFLQEAYIIADYGRRNFFVSQANFPSTAVSQQIVQIDTPKELEGNRKNETVNQEHAKLGPGGIAGVAIAGVVATALAALAIVCYCRVRKRRAETSDDVSHEINGDAKDRDVMPPGELDHDDAALAELNEDTARHELHGKKDTAELASPEPAAVVAELEAGNDKIALQS